MEFIDSHAHLDGPEFDSDRDEVLRRARAAGVAEIVVVGAAGDLETAERTVRLAEEEERLYATVGVHPHDAARMEESWWPRLRDLAGRKRVVGIGETGLDYHYDHSPPEVQKRRFAEFVELGRDVGKPVVCHVRDAHADARAILKATGAAEVGAVIHCFTGTPEDARSYVGMGCYISFSGIVTFKGKSAAPIRAAVREVPLDRLLIETDCPYLAPVPNRGKRNEPAFVVHTAEVVAQEAGIDLTELAARTVANTRRFFHLTEL
jgi:TatD DNase family protein